MVRIFTVLRGVLYATCFVLLWTWLIHSVRGFDALLPFSLPTWLRPVGFAVGLAGALLTAWCVGMFVTIGEGTPVPFDAPRKFVAAGPYRYVRNPMYIGVTTLVAGVGLMLGSASVVAVAALFVLAAHAFVTLYEEHSLERRFGDSYRSYKRRVRRWAPAISRPLEHVGAPSNRGPGPARDRRGPVGQGPNRP
jgi:protein-S-isoprenylcysteine O-methyltransferase Ste14